MKQYFRKCLDNLESYAWEKSSKMIARECGLEERDIIRFDQNTLPPLKLGLELPLVNEYPDASYQNLLTAIAKYAKVEETQIVIGAGADEIINNIINIFIEPGDNIVISTPTYPMYKVCTEIAGGKVIEVTRNFDFSIDINKLLMTAKELDAKIIFICNPNNPDGSLIPKEDIEKILNGFSRPVAIDEAYFEFCNSTVADLITKYPNLIIIRTFSKAFGLAGARVGYAISSEEIVSKMNKIRLPASISSLSVALAIGALDNVSVMKMRADQVVEERKRVAKELEKLGFIVFPSVTNFILFRTADLSDADRLFQKAFERGYIIRNFSKKCENCLRITVRTKEDNDKLLSVFSRYPDGVIFDIDGVLVDVSESYREAIKQTILAFTENKITDADIELIKKLPNSNNDWDVTYALINGIRDLRSIDRTSGAYQAAKDKFQSLYLGSLRNREKLLITRNLLYSLKQQNYKLGIVTSRPRDEALYVLRQLVPVFFSEKSIVAFEDCNVEKPLPNPLLLAKQRIGCRAAFYVGDTINDALAAKAANMLFISVKSDLEADFYLKNVNDIKEVLE
ncbi:histidinol-phosphate transaminase [Candidatus Micrarchaeota archaeon]|nr:histidinol-phosphate transaminase [Candidatus Micrarchaeota archaeon]